MDPLSQGLLGGILAGAFSKKKSLKLAVTCGVIGGLAPDLDILIKSSTIRYFLSIFTDNSHIQFFFHQLVVS